MKTRVNFFNLPNDVVIPVVLKSGVCSMVSSIFKEIKNNKSFRLQTMGAFEFGRGPRFIGPLKDDHCNKNALVPVRDVMQRFRSAVWQVRKDDERITVNEILDGLEAGTYRNQHFQSQTDILKGCDGCEGLTHLASIGINQQTNQNSQRIRQKEWLHYMPRISSLGLQSLKPGKFIKHLESCKNLTFN